MSKVKCFNVRLDRWESTGGRRASNLNIYVLPSVRCLEQTVFIMLCRVRRRGQCRNARVKVSRRASTGHFSRHGRASAPTTLRRRRPLYKWRSATTQTTASTPRGASTRSRGNAFHWPSCFLTWHTGSCTRCPVTPMTKWYQTSPSLQIRSFLFPVPVDQFKDDESVADCCNWCDHPPCLWYWSHSYLRPFVPILHRKTRRVIN